MIIHWGSVEVISCKTQVLSNSYELILDWLIPIEKGMNSFNPSKLAIFQNLKIKVVITRSWKCLMSDLIKLSIMLLKYKRRHFLPRFLKFSKPKAWIWSLLSKPLFSQGQGHGNSHRQGQGQGQRQRTGQKSINQDPKIIHRISNARHLISKTWHHNAKSMPKQSFPLILTRIRLPDTYNWRSWS